MQPVGCLFKNNILTTYAPVATKPDQDLRSQPHHAEQSLNTDRDTARQGLAVFGSTQPYSEFAAFVTMVSPDHRILIDR